MNFIALYKNGLKTKSLDIVQKLFVFSVLSIQLAVTSCPLSAIHLSESYQTGVFLFNHCILLKNLLSDCLAETHVKLSLLGKRSVRLYTYWNCYEYILTGTDMRLSKMNLFSCDTTYDSNQSVMK